MGTGADLSTTDINSVTNKNANRPNHCRRLKPDKASEFGFNFIVRIITDNDVVRPFGKISGNIEVETRFPISHLGLLVQFEAICSMRYTSKFEKQTYFHNGREMILEGTKLVDDYGYFESPIQYIISPFRRGSAADANIVFPGRSYYPFSLTIPENPNLPAGFSNEFGSLVHRLAVYLKKETGHQVAVEVGDKPMRFNGHFNLRNIGLKEISIECFYMKSVFTRKKVVEARLSVHSSGFLCGESIPFRVEYKNPKCYPLHIFVRLVQNLKYNASNKSEAVKRKSKIVKTVHTQIENDPIPEGVWTDFLHIPENQEPSYKVHFMYSVTYILQINVKIFLEIDQIDIKGSAPIYIGTTRDDVETLRTGGMSNIVVPQGIPRRSGSEASINTISSGRSLPPSYSQLSSRTTSWETLPPPYEELELIEEDVTLEDPSRTTSCSPIVCTCHEWRAK
ncbi:hypothetical protein Ocin01_18891 [Orchesella cincta]|uniref:Arrestin C-terminal-like domain-containing protein n=1 Tax=Orchesella cincta TaxID=48709 RepID=A0A1D2M488_ORCCI|nr:hypothetical protein Ocin01_18891 [Orchesella cincta]